MKVLKQGDIYAPEHLGRKDILIEGSRIARIADHIDEYDQIEEVEKVDLGGHILTPGYMDIHVHITGGGGESGPATRVPEASLQRAGEKRHYHSGGTFGYRRYNQKAWRTFWQRQGLSMKRESPAVSLQEHMDTRPPPSQGAWSGI